MSQETMIWQAVVFGAILFVALGIVIVSFVFMYQRKKYLHKQEKIQMEETFSREKLHSKNEIQEQTLRYIATEIHDNFNPTLSVINLNLAEVIPAVEDPVKTTITDTKILVKQLMAEMKALSSTLNSDQISRIGFTRSFERFVNHLKKTGIYAISFNISGDAYRLTSDKEIILFRMCQEIVNNVVKHANAKNIYINITYGDLSFKVEIKDDGKGFDVAGINSDPEKQDSTGLRNLRHRATVIDASFSITSHAGIGTTIIIELPK
jgi:signal transduction histidine kinase